jgi:DNA-binding protein H-NS
MAESSKFMLQKSEQAKEELEEIAQKVSAKAEEISRDFAKTTEDLKQAAPTTEELKQAAPKVPPEVQKSLGPEKIPSGLYGFREVFSFAGLAPEVSILTLFWLAA